MEELETDLEEAGSNMGARESWENVQTNELSHQCSCHPITGVKLTTQSLYPPTLKRQRILEFYLTDNN